MESSIWENGFQPALHSASERFVIPQQHRHTLHRYQAGLRDDDSDVLWPRDVVEQRKWGEIRDGDARARAGRRRETFQQRCR